jgi:hypothetical protein
MALAAALALTACGSSATHSSAPSATTTTTATTSSGADSGAIIPPAVAELPAAEHPQQAQFPAARGRTLQGLTAGVRPGGLLGAATGTFTPGRRRFAFALNAKSGAFIYAPSAIYIARGPNRPAQGPFLAPADPLTVPPAYRGTQNTGPGGISAIYEAQVPLAGTGTYTVLALTRTRQGLIGATGEVAVAASSRIPDVGQRPPAIATDTPDSVHGRLGLLTTRTPPESMHSASLAAVLGKQPVALLFSTPQFCVSRVCGPVTDIAVWLQRRFGRRITFLHQEVYVMNQPGAGLRPPFKAFGLQTEPWLFTIDRRGRIAARLEGSFGVNAFTEALKAALG